MIQVVRRYLVCLAIAVWAVGTFSCGKTAQVGTKPLPDHWCEVRIIAPTSVLQGEEIPIVIVIKNNGEEKQAFFRPFFWDVDSIGIGNVDIEVFRIEKGKERKVEDAFERGGIYDKTTEVELAPDREAKFEFSLRRYFGIALDDVGKYRLAVRLNKITGDSAAGSSSFVIVPRTELQRKEVIAQMDEVTAKLIRENPSRTPMIRHRAVLIRQAEKRLKLVYESTLRGAKGSVTICEGKDIGDDFAIVHANRDIPPAEGVIYDALLRVRYGVEDSQTKPLNDEPQFWPIFFCDYVAVLYVKERSLYLTVFGRYGPRPSEVRKGTLLPKRCGREPDIICTEEKIQATVKKIKKVETDRGFIKVTFIDAKGVEKTILLDERGQESVSGT